MVITAVYMCVGGDNGIGGEFCWGNCKYFFWRVLYIDVKIWGDDLVRNMMRNPNPK